MFQHVKGMQWMCKIVYCDTQTEFMLGREFHGLVDGASMQGLTDVILVTVSGTNCMYCLLSLLTPRLKHVSRKRWFSGGFAGPERCLTCHKWNTGGLVVRLYNPIEICQNALHEDRTTKSLLIHTEPWCTCTLGKIILLALLGIEPETPPNRLPPLVLLGLVPKNAI